MPYMDIWMYNSRPRMRVFLCYFLIFITFFIFSDVMIYLYTQSAYKPIENEIISINPEITIETAKASNASGTVKGTIKNNTNEAMTNQYLKFDFYTPRNVNAGTKYLKISQLNSQEEKKYELEFRYDNVNFVKVSTVSEDQVKGSTVEELEVNPVIGTTGLMMGILSLYVFF